MAATKECASAGSLGQEITFREGLDHGRPDIGCKCDAEDARIARQKVDSGCPARDEQLTTLEGLITAAYILFKVRSCSSMLRQIISMSTTHFLYIFYPVKWRK